MAMANAAESAEDSLASKAGRALGFASSFTVCLVTAGALAITLWGRPKISSLTLEIRPPSPSASHVSLALLGARSAPETHLGPITSALYAGKTLLADPALIENTASGPLPRIADDGRRPMGVYAAPAPSGAKFKIALVVDGLGLSARQTQAALATLPADVSLGFAPYSPLVNQWVAQARARGHEVLLEIPMEPLDFPDSDPGPNTLRSGQEEDANIQRLKWALTRFTGYAGVTNLLGARFLTDSQALSPTLAYLGRRGLYFFDNGTTAQSLVPTLSIQLGVAFAQATSSIDAIQTPSEIDRRLTELEDEARAKGVAVGTANLYPVSLARIAAWAKGLGARGFDLVPLSAVVETKNR